MSPLVSIGMPVHNCVTTIETCIRSVLLQTYTNWELLIVDDGSSDNTAGLARRFKDPRIRVFEGDTNRGLPYRLNQLIDLAQGEFFCRMDGDDICFPDRIEKQIAFLHEHPEVNVVGSSALVIDSNNRPLSLRQVATAHNDIVRELYKGFSIMHPTLMGGMDWFRKYKYRDVRRVEDQDLYLRSYKHSRFANIESALIAYRDTDYSYRKSHEGRRNYYMRVSDIYIRERNYTGLTAATFRYLLKEALYSLDSRIFKSSLIMGNRNRTTVPATLSDRFNQLLYNLKCD